MHDKSLNSRRLIEHLGLSAEGLDFGLVIGDLEEESVLLDGLLRELPTSASRLRQVASSLSDHRQLVSKLLDQAHSAIDEHRRIGQYGYDFLGRAIDYLATARTITEDAQRRQDEAAADADEWNAANKFFEAAIAEQQEDGRQVTPVEFAALHALEFGVEGLSPIEFRTRLAQEMVLTKMLCRWVDAGMEESLSNYFANRLQLWDGNNGQAIARDTIRRRINQSARRYCHPGSTMTGQGHVRDQVAARFLFPGGPWPLFWMHGKPLTFHQERSRQRRRRHPPAEHSVRSWACDTCGARYKSGASQPEVMPNRPADRADSRLSKRYRGLSTRTDSTVRALPGQAWLGDAYMCPCWTERAGILSPEFA